MKKQRVLVMGATGTVGRHLVSELAQRGAEILAATRTPHAPRAQDLGVPPVLFDLEDRTTWRLALVGVDRVFLVARPGDDAPQRAANPLIDEMGRAGVRHVVDLSAMGADSREDFGLRQVERHLEASGLAYTHLRPNFFLQIFTTGALVRGIRATGTIEVPAADARLSFIDARDIARVAACVLSENGHEGQAYTLTGAEAVDHGTIAAALTEASGREIRYVGLDEESARRHLREAGFPAERLERLIGFYRLVRAGFCSPVTDAVERILGCPPVTLARFAHDHASCWL